LFDWLERVTLSPLACSEHRGKMTWALFSLRDVVMQNLCCACGGSWSVSRNNEGVNHHNSELSDKKIF